MRKRKEEEKEKREKEEEGEKEKEEESKKGGQEGGKVKARILWASHTLSISTLDSFFTNPHAWSLEHILLEEYNVDSWRLASILELGAEDVVLLDTNLILSSSSILGEMQASLSSVASHILLVVGAALLEMWASVWALSIWRWGSKDTETSRLHHERLWFL